MFLSFSYTIIIPYFWRFVKGFFKKFFGIVGYCELLMLGIIVSIGRLLHRPLTSLLYHIYGKMSIVKIHKVSREKRWRFMQNAQNGSRRGFASRAQKRDDYSSLFTISVSSYLYKMLKQQPQPHSYDKPMRPSHLSNGLPIHCTCAVLPQFGHFIIFTSKYFMYGRGLLRASFRYTCHSIKKFFVCLCCCFQGTFIALNS